MAYKIKYHGYDVLCDTVDEIRALVNENGASSPKPNPAKPFVAQLQGGSASSALAGFVAKLNKEQQNLLRHVATSGRVKRERLRELVGVSDPHQFAGILISISKSAVGSGMKSPIEILHERENGNGPRSYQYKIRDDIKTAVKEALAIQ
jgi:hypothetical protein